LPGTPALVWDFVTSPARRVRWQAGVDSIEEATANGRRGVGTVNHCIHGKDAIVEEILDWRPPEYYTFDFKVPIPGAPMIEPMFTAGRVALEPLLAEELARQAAEAAGQREPELQVSAGRFINEPF